MELVEVRDFDGPNLFRMEPVVKVEVRFAPDDARDALERRIRDAVVDLHRRLELAPPGISTHRVDDPDHLVIAFDWEWRGAARGIARCAVDAAIDPGARAPVDRLRARLDEDRRECDRPLWVRDAGRRIKCVGITGTNGKTTTTRLLAHIVQKSRGRVGWSSSTGVYINGERVLEGDYSGPEGARRVLGDPGVDVAVLETARGGLLRRGLAYESNDVGVFLNVSADHLSLLGVETLETLAEVKSVVVRATRAGGLVVLNADDDLVLACRERLRAPVLLTSRHPEREAVARHIAAGGKAVVLDGGDVLYVSTGRSERVAAIVDVPVTFGGAAPFMAENALAATGAAIGLGIDVETIALGLTTFRNDSVSNLGRLNVFDVAGRVVVLDYAHNDTGLVGLLGFCRALAGGRGRLHVIVGTAGDRRDEDFLALGRIARERAERVYLKDTTSYLRGREPGEMVELMRAGFERSGGPALLAGTFEDEFSAVVAALDGSESGDHIAVMCQVDQDRIIEVILRRGGVERR